MNQLFNTLMLLIKDQIMAIPSKKKN